MYLGLDQASATGFAFSDSTGNIIESGTVRFSGQLPARLTAMQSWLDKVLVEKHPEAIAYEKPHFRGYDSTISCVGCVIVILLAAYKYNIPVIGVHTGTLKKWATGDGKAEKEDMVRLAEQITGKKFDVKKNNDETDAIHLSRYCAQEFSKHVEA